ncbi:MAG: hypothetical protein R2751_13985 [Bacteroidales bacterium]
MFLLYCNEACVVVGKHQNALAEIDPDYVRRHRIRVARRISGGGAVFRDEGNLNFAFLTTGKEGELVDYRRHTRPIVDALARLGLEVHLGKAERIASGGGKDFRNRQPCAPEPGAAPRNLVVQQQTGGPWAGTKGGTGPFYRQSCQVGPVRE